MKKMFATTAALVMAMSLIGCGNSASSEETTAATTEEAVVEETAAEETSTEEATRVPFS